MDITGAIKSVATVVSQWMSRVWGTQTRDQSAVERDGGQEGVAVDGDVGVFGHEFADLRGDGIDQRNNELPFANESTKENTHDDHPCQTDLRGDGIDQRNNERHERGEKFGKGGHHGCSPLLR